MRTEIATSEGIDKTMNGWPHKLLVCLALWITPGGALMAIAEPRVTVFAAASLKNSLDEIAERFERTNAIQVSLSYAGSSALARQIQYGAPAQIYISANTIWMDLLEDEGLLVPEARADIASNRLVLIAGPGLPERHVTIAIAPGMDLAGALQGNRLAMALIDAVPAGIYGRAALIRLGVWDRVQGQVVQTDNVRAALRLVALGEAAMGIVYATDAAAEPLVRLVGVFPAESHPPIVYPAARVAQGDSAASRTFFRFLNGPQARAILQRHGFGQPGQGGS